MVLHLHLDMSSQIALLTTRLQCLVIGKLVFHKHQSGSPFENNSVSKLQGDFRNTN